MPLNGRPALAVKLLSWILKNVVGSVNWANVKKPQYCWHVSKCIFLLLPERFFLIILCVSRMALNRNLLITNVAKMAACPWPVPRNWRGWPSISTAARCLRLGPPSPSLSSRWNRRLPSSSSSSSSSFWGCWSCAASESFWIRTVACRVPHGQTIWKKTRSTTALPELLARFRARRHAMITSHAHTHTHARRHTQPPPHLLHLRADCIPQVLLFRDGGFVYLWVWIFHLKTALKPTFMSHAFWQGFFNS